MNPRAARLGALGQFRKRIEGAGIDVAGLQAKNRRPVDFRQKVGAHAPLRIGTDLDDATASQSQDTQGFEQGGMCLGADDDADRGSAEQPVGFNIPAGALEHLVARGRQAAEIRLRRPGHESTGRVARQIENVEQPAQRGLLERGDSGRGTMQGGVLIPGRWSRDHAERVRRSGRRADGGKRRYQYPAPITSRARQDPWLLSCRKFLQYCTQNEKNTSLHRLGNCSIRSSSGRHQSCNLLVQYRRDSRHVPIRFESCRQSR